ncbi:uncharacterized protein LOC141906151 isoform X2 [Tubulanus polymorphus]|uniref:uncharacterized protein LOC141904594 isoform X2 n=2 Tax=Tubulanus polymorphus TaxID=672921 RepID=UPI003DA22406
MNSLPLAVSDKAGQLFRDMFPGHPNATNYKCGRTKTTHIVNAVATDIVSSTVSRLKSSPFVLGVDGSTYKQETYYPIVVRYVDEQLETKLDLLANPIWNQSHTGEAIFNIIKAELEVNAIPWENLLSLVCDNTNSNVGRHKGVIKYVRDHQKEVHLAGCVNHLLHLALKKGLNTAIKPLFDFDDLLRQLHWYVTKTSKRSASFQTIQKECGLPDHTILKHVATRWLSMGPALSRMLEQWEALRRYFAKEIGHDTDGDDDQEFLDDFDDGPVTAGAIKTKLHKFFQRRTSKLYTAFLIKAISVFESTNGYLETESALVHKVKRILERLMYRLLLCICKPAAFNQGCTPYSIDFTSRYNIKDKKDLFIGDEARKLVETVTDETKKKFYQDVVKFYSAACTYLKEKVNPKDQPLWSHAEVADPLMRKR